MKELLPFSLSLSTFQSFSAFSIPSSSPLSARTLPLTPKSFGFSLLSQPFSCLSLFPRLPLPPPSLSYHFPLPFLISSFSFSPFPFSSIFLLKSPLSLLSPLTSFPLYFSSPHLLFVSSSLFPAYFYSS